MQRRRQTEGGATRVFIVSRQKARYTVI